MVILTALKDQLPFVFTNDPAVAALATYVLPLLGFLSVNDGLGTVAHGLLRGIGKQAIGSIANIFAHYVVGLPIGLALGIALDMKLWGLWMGLTIGLIV